MTNEQTPSGDVEALTEALARPLEDWDRRTLDYAVSHIYSAWPENRNLDRDAFLNELIYYIERLRDERDDERASLAAELAQVVAARAAERERELRALAWEAGWSANNEWQRDRGIWTATNGPRPEVPPNPYRADAAARPETTESER